VAVLESLIQLGRTLGVQVVAQGIETPEQLDALMPHGLRTGPGPAAVARAGTGAHRQKLAQQLPELGYRSLIRLGRHKRPPSV
jgi:predicted signal transduction protein with EAL and GGDEF domain